MAGCGRIAVENGANIEPHGVSQLGNGLHESLGERSGATMLARHAARGFNLPKEDARKLRKAFEGGAGGEKARKHQVAKQRDGFFDERRLDVFGLSLRNVRVGRGQLCTQVGNFFGGKRGLHGQSDEKT